MSAPGSALLIGFAAFLCCRQRQECKAVVPLLLNELHSSVEWPSLPFFEINSSEQCFYICIIQLHKNIKIGYKLILSHS